MTCLESFKPLAKYRADRHRVFSLSHFRSQTLPTTEATSERVQRFCALSNRASFGVAATPSELENCLTIDRVAEQTYC